MLNNPTVCDVTNTQGDLFEERLDAYLRRQLKRGVPPLLITLKDLYVDPAKVEVIGRLAEKFVNNLRSDSKFDMDGEFVCLFVCLFVFYFV